MNRKKRDREERAFHNGYHAGIKGHSSDQCPFTSDLTRRELWLGGWRDGWGQFKNSKH